MQTQSYEEYFSEELKHIFKEIKNGLLGDPEEFKDLISSISNKNDYYLIGYDFKDYLRA